MQKERIDFRKYDALGNDYLVIDPNHCDLRIAPDSVRLLCDRHHGIGGDGILVGPVLSETCFGLRIFNPDGSECEKSGNGLRIFARFLVDLGYAPASRFQIRLLQSGQDVPIECLDESAGRIKVDMGTYRLASAGIPARNDQETFLDQPLAINGSTLRVSCVDVGNPHCVVLGQPVSASTAKTLGPLICGHPLFPNRTNVQVAEVMTRDSIRIEIWERGAGYTLASGSSSCAAAAACFELGLIDRAVTVSMPGGTVDIEICPDRRILLAGSVRAVASGSLAADLKSRLVT